MNRLFALTVLLMPLTAWAQVEPLRPAPMDSSTGFRLTVDAATPPSPSLQYELRPQLREYTPGNAALHYHRASLMVAELPTKTGDKFRGNCRDWEAKPLDEATCKAMREWLDEHQSIWLELRTAAYRERCDFDHELRDLSGFDASNYALPEIQAMRELNRMLRIKARLEIRDGRFDAAIDSLRVGFRLARDASTSPLVVSSLAGGACARTTVDSVSEWIAAPNSPNLYWALATLPRPYIDTAHGLLNERRFCEQFYPAMKDMGQASLSPQQWENEFVDAVKKLMISSNGVTTLSEDETRWFATGILLKTYPAAKQRLIEAGFDRQMIESLPPAQVVTMQTARVTRHVCDELLKWLALPTDQALIGLEKSQEKLRAEKLIGGDPTLYQGALPIVDMIMPPVYMVRYSLAQLDRKMAAHQLIEALRWHAAVHGGKLPETLAEIQVAPTPSDPVTGKPFLYRLQDNFAVIDMPPPHGKPGDDDSVRYEIAIRPKK